MRFPLKIHKRLTSENLLQIAAAAFILLGAVQLWRRSHPAPSLLDRKFAKIDLRDEEVGDSLNRLCRAAGMKLIFDDQSEPSDLFKVSDRVDMHLTDVPMGAVLGRLNAVCLSTYTFDARLDGLYVTRTNRLPAVLHVYDLTDIIDRVGANPHANRGHRVAAPPSSARDERVDQIVTAIRFSDRHFSLYAGSTTMPTGVIVPVGTRILVMCPEPVHRWIELFLRDFRKMAANRLAP